MAFDASETIEGKGESNRQLFQLCVLRFTSGCNSARHACTLCASEQSSSNILLPPLRLCGVAEIPPHTAQLLMEAAGVGGWGR